MIKNFDKTLIRTKTKVFFLIKFNKMSFSTSFLNILKGKDPLEDLLIKVDTRKIYETNLESIIHTMPYFLQGIKREQFLIETTPDYYISRDSKTNTVYMCFKELLMLDFDNTSLEQLSVLESLPLAFKIYRTTKGYHAFCISKKFEYRNKDTVEFMLKFKEIGVDIDYIRFCYLRGFCVRLNKKFEQSGENYTLFKVTKPELIDLELEKLVDLHFKKCKKYKKDLNIN